MCPADPPVARVYDVRADRIRLPGSILRELAALAEAVSAARAVADEAADDVRQCYRESVPTH